MSLFDISALLLTLAALFSYVNYRFIRLPGTMGLTLISLLFSLSLIAAGHYWLDLETTADGIVAQIDFSQALMQGMLSFLLFAGALHINLESLAKYKWSVATLATAGVLLSTLLTGITLFFLLGWIGLPLDFGFCLIFGALISPTDPIAVLSLLKQAKAPKDLEIKIAGESLFNDGIGVVVFIITLEVVTGASGLDFSRVAFLLVQEALGGILLGLALGWITFLLLRSIDNYQVEILLTLALVTGGYALASALHTSGPLAIVAAGLLIGNHGRHFAMSDRTRERLDAFWELVDNTLNAILFVLIGLELLVVKLTPNSLLAGLAAIPVVLLARFASVGLTAGVFRILRDFSPHLTKVLTWGGLRGGISVALALSLPAGAGRDLLLTVTYSVVVFSILVQGLTMPALLRRTLAAESGKE